MLARGFEVVMRSRTIEDVEAIHLRLPALTDGSRDVLLIRVTVTTAAGEQCDCHAA